MAQTAALMQRAKGRAPQGFQKPDIAQFTPPDVKDAVDRVVAAGQKVMYSPDMRQELMAEIQRKTPTSQKMAEAVTGLLLTLDKQTKGGIPMAAIFPAGLELMSEAAETLQAAGETVDQATYNEAAQMMFVLLGKKLGATEQQMMATAEQAAGGAESGAESEPGEGMAHEQAEAPPVEQQETANEAAGMPEDDEQPMRGA